MKFQIRIYEWESWGGPTVLSDKDFTINLAFNMKEGLQIALTRKNEKAETK